MKLKSLLFVSAVILFGEVVIASETQGLELAAPFTDNMILQRETAVPVWGFDVSGAKVTVEFAGQKKTAVADKNGDWMVKLEPLEVSRTERSFTVKNDRGGSIVLNGVLVGEVWFSSGQSNMVWVANKSMCRDLANEIAKADIPIREINIDTVSALYPQKKATSDGGWKKAKEVNNFSALSLSFAYELYKELDMPIGILLSAHSNTRIEAFTQREAIESHPKLDGDADLIHDADPLTEQGCKAYQKYYNDLRSWQKEAGEIAAAGGKVPAKPSLPGIAGMWRGPSQFFNGKINPVVPYAIRGAIWCQGTSNSNDGKIYAARMEALVNGWRDAWDMPDMPFYFTQMQCYGAENPDNVGFADIRQAQHMFFMDNRKNVGMVVQTDLNSARPGGIHYFNKLHPGMRMARWALAKDYGKEIAYTGPIYSGYEVDGSEVIISFEKESLFGGLMVGSKGMAADYREPGKYVEPARPTPGKNLNHFRLCGEDKKWHAAGAYIAGDKVVVTSVKVPKPIGVQYAYNSVPMNSNLYNKAGLPATPFAAVNGKLIFEEDDPAKAAAEKAKYARYTDPDYPILQVVEYFRDGAIIQRDKMIPVWGHANEGVEVTVTLGGITRTAVANKLQQWSVEFPAMKASAKPITLEVKASHGHGRTVRDILVGDVWYLTGSTMLSSEWPYNLRDKDAKIPEPMPLVREFRRKTKASTSPTPRKRSFETGGGKYRSSWMAADFSGADKGVTMFAYQFARALDRRGIPQGFITMSSGSGGRSSQMASPLSWTSFNGVKDVKNPAFKAQLDELFLQYPDTEIAEQAADNHVAEVKAAVKTIIDAGQSDSDFSKTAPLQMPSFPEPGKSDTVKTDMIPTYAYNWCVSPMTPMAVAGVIWVPSQYNLGYNPENYAAEMEIYANSLPGTYGMDQVKFLYAQPAKSLVGGISAPAIPGAKKVMFDEWPKSLKDIAIKLGELAAEDVNIKGDYLRCQYMVDPQGVDADSPRLSWIVKSDIAGQEQSAYRVLVASSMELLQKDRGDLWDSGKVESDETAAVVYAGKKLASGQQCYWKVMTFDKNGNKGKWSAPAYWSMGLVDSEWNAAWIGFDKPRADAEKALENSKSKLLLVPASYLRKEFTVDKPVKRAVLYASSLGNYKMIINGEAIGEDYFAPGWTDYKTRIYYNTYNVTEQVKKGANAVSGILADGWYSGYIGWGKKRDHYGKNPRLSAQLVLEYKDGSKAVVATDKTWKANTGPIIEGSFLHGETYDARLEQNGWDKPGFNDSGWTKPDVTEKIAAKIEAYPANTVKVFQEIKPLSVKEPVPGNFVFDMGTNFAGIARLKVKAPKGTAITLKFAERLKSDGTLYTKNLRAARVTDTYICKGGGVEVWQPEFTFHGFQYVGITGYPGKPDLDTITGIELTSATPETGSFECSDSRLNQLYHNICQTQRANFIDIPTDCPQRDERMGWTGDAQAYVRTAGLNTDVQAFFKKWIVDLTDAQYENGDFPCVAPMVHINRSGGPAWSDAGIICPWAIYEMYGDKDILAKHYDDMARFVDYLVNAAVDNLAPKKFACYGDWLSISANTPKEVIYTAYSAGDAKMMAEIARVLGKDEDVKKFNKIYEDFKAAFNRAYVSPEGIVKGDTQTAYILALWFDLVDGKMKEKAEQYLVERIKERDWHLSTGFVGTRDLMHVLAKIGRTDIAYRLMFTDTYPSWLFPVKNGATSIWERWNSWTPENGFGNAGMNSFSHYAYGAVGQWMFENIGGIRALEPGYKKIEIAPKPTDKLTYAKTGFNSIRGLIRSDWKIEGNQFKMSVTVPANTTAIIRVPGGTESSANNGAEFIKIDNSDAVFKAASGTYSFTSSLQ